MSNEKSHFKLRCSLLGHSMDVRAVTVTSNSDIITASRDKTAKLWSEDPDNRNYFVQKVEYSGHDSYVTSICIIENFKNSHDDLVATGSKDSNILIYPKLSSEAVHKLSGHTDSVSCIAWKNDFLVSGSWDHTIKIWNNWKCISTLNGHIGPIWAVAFIDSDTTCPHIISASADKTIKLWKNGKVVITYNGHSDCVRGIAMVNNERFLSCSNDASIKLWNISGECLATYYGHSNFIYSISCAQDGKSFISGSEDRTLRRWEIDGVNIQTIYLPAQSVWAVAVLPNSDIVAASSDGVCRVFTSATDRHDDQEALQLFENKLSTFKVALDNVGGIKKADLPDKTILHSPGKRDGQTIMVRDADKILCYNWSQGKQQWESVGEVVGASGSNKVMYEGREYDFVFDVDVDTGSAIKLPYNNGEDPWVVAQAFIYLHELPQDYLDTVAGFITKNAGITDTGTTSSSLDPFTGGSRYVPGGQGSSSISQGGDSFTGASRYVPDSAQSSSVRVSQYFPQMHPVPFINANKEGILTKLKECCANVSDPLTECQMEILVNSVISNPENVSDLSPLQNALQWHPKNVWPVLDVLRLALRFENVQLDWIKANNKGEVLICLLVSLLGSDSCFTNTQLLSLRCLSNFACHAPGRQVLASSRDSVMTAALKLSPYSNKNLEIAVSTLLLNYSFIFYSMKSIEDQCQILSGAATIALISSDPEALFRSLVALGTLLSLGGELIPLSRSLDLKPVIENLLSANYTEKVRDCAKDIIKML